MKNSKGRRTLGLKLRCNERKELTSKMSSWTLPVDGMQGRKEGRKEGRKKEGRKEGRRTGSICRDLRECHIARC